MSRCCDDHVDSNALDLVDFSNPICWCIDAASFGKDPCCQQCPDYEWDFVLCSCIICRAQRAATLV